MKLRLTKRAPTFVSGIREVEDVLEVPRSTEGVGLHTPTEDVCSMPCVEPYGETQLVDWAIEDL